MAVGTSSHGILSPDRTDDREQIIGMLKQAYWMEIETVMSYITNSINPDGVRAQEIVESLQQDIQEELGHAQQFAQRIKELYGVVPGSLEFSAEQSYLQPPEEQTDIVHVIKGVSRRWRDRALQRDHRRHRRDRSGDERHGHRDPPRRGGAPPPVRGLPARVRGRGQGVAAQPSTSVASCAAPTGFDSGEPRWRR